MRRYTTPTLTLIAQRKDEHSCLIKPIDLTPHHVWVTLEQPNVELEFDSPTMTLEEDGTHVTIALTQQQTAQLQVGTAEVQINWMTADGVRGATEIGRVRLDRNLLEEVREYGV
jgi:hypothetical protein